MLAGNALAFTAYQQTASGRGTDTAVASCERAHGAATPKVEALLLERSAWAHATTGAASSADTALRLAREALHRDDDRPEPDWVFWVDDQELDIMSGRCWAELRRPLRAVPVLDEALARFDDTHARDKALYLTWLASAYLQAGEVVQAADIVQQASDLANGVASARPTARIRSLARQLEQHRDMPEVATVLDQLVADSTHAR